MNITVRDFRPADAEAAAEARRTAQPFIITTPELLRWETEHSPAERHFRLLVAELDGEVVGMARTSLVPDGEPGQALANPFVHPERTGRGVGSALLAAAERHLAELGARTVYTWAMDDGRSPGWAEKHGYRRRPRQARFLRLDLASAGLPERTEPPNGIQLRTAAGFAADPRPLFELDAEVAEDEPGDVDPGFTYQVWLDSEWRRPVVDHDLSVVAVDDGVPVAFTLAHTDGHGRYLSGMTGTARSHRGLGLAKVVKNHSLHLARAAGYREAYTHNDAENAPMLAVNQWFGYQQAMGELRYVRELG